MKTITSLARTPCSKPPSARLRTACATWLLPLLLLTPPAALQAQFTFVTNNGTITITGYTGTNTVVVIPSSTNNYPVTGIAHGVNTEQPVFSANLTSVTIPASVTNIGVGVFSYCTNLTAITVDALNSAYSSVNGVLFNSSQTTLIQCPGGEAGNYTIPNSVTSIAEGAFYDCTGLTGVVIPNSVTGIGARGFSNCSGLTNVIIGINVTDIGVGAFSHCTGLTSVVITNSVISIGAGGFGACIGLTSLIMGANVLSIGEGAFHDCTGLTSVVIPNGVVSIEGWGAFVNCTSLTNVIIGNGLTNIGDALHAYPAFPGCTSLTSITVNTDNPAYSSLDGVLFNRSQTTLVEYPTGKAGAYTIPNSVAAIGYEAFIRCAGLTSVTAGNNLRSIESDAFLGCSSLTNITVGESLINLGSTAFEGCFSLMGAYFLGNAPPLDFYGPYMFEYDINATVYYLPGTTGWGTNYGGRPTAPWFLPNPLILPGPSFGVQTNGFGFIITWATNIPVVVEACADLAHPLWSPVGTNILTDGWSYFSDPQWTNYPARLYRLRSP